MSGEEYVKPGEILPAPEAVKINAGRRSVKLTVKNTGDRPIQVGSHFHFFEANKALEFDRARAFGMRLDIPAGTSVRFEPGDEREVTLVEFGGSQYVWGFNGLTQGTVRSHTIREHALARAKTQGYRGA